MSVVANDKEKQCLQDAAEEYIREYDRLKEEEKERAKVCLVDNSSTWKYIENHSRLGILRNCNT